MRIGQSSIVALLIGLSLSGAPCGAQEGGNGGDEAVRGKVVGLWSDFIHYLRIARLDLAKSSGQALLDTEIDDADLLTVVDQLAPYRDYERTLITAQKMSDAEVVKIAEAVEKRVEQARLNLARDPVRVRRSIELLDDGLRARLNATERLKSAGEYAAPELLNVLLSGEDVDKALQPYVQQAIVEVGRPLVGPLTEAFPNLPPVPKQQVAEALAQIGYPLALPYLKAELGKDIDRETRQVIETAFDRIVERSGVPRGTDAAQLFLMLGEDYYQRPETLVLEPAAEFNLLWSYDARAGLTYQQIPTAVFHDVMAMRSAKRSLGLNKQYAAPLSLYIAANFRRENNLGENEDPSYPPEAESPHYYATLGGPTHLLPVLTRALDDRDAELALDAIRAIAATATTAERIGKDVQPIIAAMVYPDRRVRFEAAFAMSRSLPRVEFSGAGRVVPVLGEAIHESALANVIMISPDQDAVSLVRESLGEEYRLWYGTDFDDAAQRLGSLPGVDLVVVHASQQVAEAAVASAGRQPKMMGAPVLVLATAEALATTTEALSRNKSVTVTSIAATPEELAAAAKQAMGSVQGSAIDADQALGYATTALDELLNLTMESGQVFRAADAEPALLAALDDEREPVVLGSARVLARLPSAAAQKGIASAALDDARDPAQRVALLRSLSESARLHGNLLPDAELQLLLRLVRESDGELADAAAEAHGALDLPTANAVEFLP